MSAKVADQIADFSSDIGVRVLNEHFKVSVDVRVVDRLVEVFVDSGKL